MELTAEKIKGAHLQFEEAMGKMERAVVEAPKISEREKTKSKEQIQH